MSTTDFKGYVVSLNEVVVEMAREAKIDKDKAIGTEEENFRTGYLSCFHRVITLMQQQAQAYDIDLVSIGLGDIDESELV